MKSSGPFSANGLWRGKILSVDPQCWNFLTKTPGRKPMEPQRQDLNLKKNNWGAGLGYTGKEQKVQALNVVQVSGCVRSEAASFCGWLQQTSKAVNLIPLSWTCRNVLNHMFHYGSITMVAAARVYCPGQFSKDHSSTKPTILWAPERKIEPPSNLDADKSPAKIFQHKCTEVFLKMRKDRDKTFWLFGDLSFGHSRFAKSHYKNKVTFVTMQDSTVTARLHVRSIHQALNWNPDVLYSMSKESRVYTKGI